MTRYPKKPYHLTTDELLKLGVKRPECVTECYTMGHTLTVVTIFDSTARATYKFKVDTFGDESLVTKKGAWQKPEVKQG